MAAAVLLGALTVPQLLAPAAAQAESAPGLVLAFDTTDSVSPEQFADAQAAAGAFLDRLPADVDVGLVAFDEQARVVVEPGSDRGTVRQAVGDLGVVQTRGTALYDAVDLTLDQLADYDDGYAIFVTDGEQVPRDGDLAGRSAQLAVVATAQGTRVSGIAIQPEGAPVPDDWTSLVEASGGAFVSVADSDDLVSGLTEGLEEAAGEELLPAPDPSPAAAPPPVPPAPPAGSWIGDLVESLDPLPGPVVWVASGALFVGAVVAGLAFAGIANAATGPEVRRRRAVDEYRVLPGLPQPALAPPTRLGDNVVARSTVEVAERLVSRSNVRERLTRRLTAADVPLRPGEWVVVQAAVCLGLGLLLLAASLGNPVGLVLGVTLGLLGSAALLTVRGTRRRKAFHDALPDMLQMLASSLRVGYSLQQAMDTVVREGREPVRTEFQRALVETRLGLPVERGLDGIADRVDSQDFRWVVTSVRIQREVGGNLAELLDTVADTMRERERLRRHVDALAAEGRLSAWIIGGLPVVFVGYLLLARPGYLTPLTTEPLGILLVVLSVVTFSVGLLGLRWATRVQL